MCKRELDRHMLCPSKKKEGLKKIAKEEKFRWEDSALSLSQLRELEVLLRRECEKCDGEDINWDTLDTSKLQKLAKEFMPEGSATYPECVNKNPVKPNYMLLAGWGL